VHEDRLPADFLGATVRLLDAPVGDHEAALQPGEAAAVARAVPRRRHQFATGRLLAHRLLDELGAGGAPLLPGPDRAPLWPPGVTGSISHTEAHVLVAVAALADVASVGIDIEERTALADDLHDMVLTPTELAWLRTQPADERGLLAKLCFSAKEAVYKTQATLSRTLLEFHEVELQLDRDASRFVARLPQHVVPAVGRSELAGRWWEAGATLVTGLVIEA